MCSPFMFLMFRCCCFLCVATFLWLFIGGNQFLFFCVYLKSRTARGGRRITEWWITLVSVCFSNIIMYFGCHLMIIISLSLYLSLCVCVFVWEHRNAYNELKCQWNQFHFHFFFISRVFSLSENNYRNRRWLKLCKATLKCLILTISHRNGNNYWQMNG